MCGIAGFLQTPGATAESLTASVEQMIGRIVHRGPDDGGTWVDAAGGVALGFRRLAIIDLSALGHQPMQSADGRFTISFNGEVYNFAEMRVELEQRGARFRGHSDTEVMLAAITEWGLDAALSRFVGMFAFALWDTKERTLHLARDRFGKKPLYVYWEPGFISWGSELKALRAAPRFDAEVDADAVHAYLRYLYVPAPRSIHKRVQKLLPGHVMTVRDAAVARPSSRAFWSVAEMVRRGIADPFTGSEAEAIAESERLIGDAASLRMVADVPLGAFLSGGIDSSTVVALMQERSTRPVRTFSIGFDVAAYDESAHAAAVAKHLGTSHSAFHLTADDALRLVPSVADWFDEPLADPSQLPTYLICREARRDVTVAVSGDGGDEVFGGYNRYVQGEGLLQRGATLGPLGRRLARGAIASMSPSTWNRVAAAAGRVLPAATRYREPGEKLQKIAMALRNDSAAGMYRSLLSAGLQDPSTVLTRGAASRDAIDVAFGDPAALGAVERMMWADQAEYLPDDLLAKVDRVSMAVSLEVRVPLLDHRVAAFAWRLPRQYKIRGGETKWMLRQMLYKRVPRELVERPKMGFSVPIAHWLRGALKPWAEDLFSGLRSGPDIGLDVAGVQRYWGDFASGRGDATALGAWALLNLVAWSRRWG